MLRVVICGSAVDDVAALIDRLSESYQPCGDDRLGGDANISADPKSGGLAALLGDPEPAREPGTAREATFRSFQTANHRLVVTGVSGDEQRTRSLVAAASTADLVVPLVDARMGVSDQTRRCTVVASLLGIRRIVLAVNAADLAKCSQGAFDAIAGDFVAFAGPLKFDKVDAIPISVQTGDNIAIRSSKTPWHTGPALLDCLNEMDVTRDEASRPFRFAVEQVDRQNADLSGCSGRVLSGRIRRGDQVIAAGSGAAGDIVRLARAEGDLDDATAGEAVSLTFGAAFDISRGDMLVHPQERPEVANQFAAHVIWLGEAPLLPGRTYLLRNTCRTTPALVSSIKYKLNVETQEHLAARNLHSGDIAFCNLATTVPVAFDAYDENRDTGGFVLIDRASNAIVGAGMIAFGLRRATNIHRERMSVDKSARAEQKHQKPVIIWLTGLSGSGKSTIARALEAKLHAGGQHTYTLDGDNVRHDLNKDLGFTDADRVENIRRTGEVAKLFVDAGLIVICAFISPFAAERQMVRSLVGPGEFIEVHVDTPLDECMRRDPKGLYAKARAGTIKNFTGIDSPYEPPQSPDIRLDTTTGGPAELAERLLDYLRASGHVF